MNVDSISSPVGRSGTSRVIRDKSRTVLSKLSNKGLENSCEVGNPSRHWRNLVAGFDARLNTNLPPAAAASEVISLPLFLLLLLSLFSLLFGGGTYDIQGIPLCIITHQLIWFLKL